MIGIARVVEESAPGYNFVQHVRSPEQQQLIVKTYDWTAFFQLLGFRHIPGILQYHVFRFDSSEPGTIFVKEYSTSPEVAIKVLKPPILPFDLSFPSEIPPKGLDLERQWYLYEKIRILCHSNLCRDITCPKPLLPKPKKAHPSSNLGCNQVTGNIQTTSTGSSPGPSGSSPGPSGTSNSTIHQQPIITPHAQRERGKVIGRGVHIYIYIYVSVVEKKI